ncbi:Probable Co/Zn/Cd efflux system membrane fusion protein, partial [hydrothermal vent metagenome]
MDRDFINSFKDKVLKDGKKHWQLIVVGVVVGIIVANVFSGGSSKGRDSHSQHSAEGSSGEKKVKYWTCAMHPQIKLPKEGQCPICSMDLIPVYEG